jgi:hypothetical protein
MSECVEVMELRKEVASPLPLPYTGCSLCEKGYDCGRHSMDHAWRSLVTRLQNRLTKACNERDYWQARCEKAEREGGKVSGLEEEA